MKPFLLLSILYFLGSALARPSISAKRDTCPADYAACSRFNHVLAYCYDLLSGPVYGWPGSEVAKAEAPKPYTAESIHLNTPLMTRADIDCVCSAQGTTPTGWDAALKCYFCKIPTNTASDIEEYKTLVGQWVITCDTWGKLGVADAVTCWNSNFEEGCWVPIFK